MSRKIRIHLPQEDGKDIRGTLTLGGGLLELLRNQSRNAWIGPDDEVGLSPRVNLTSRGSSQDDDYNPQGALIFVVAVILLYGFSMVLMIGSHVFNKKKTIQAEVDKQTDQYLDQTLNLKCESQRQSFVKLRASLIPVIAKSPSGRELMAKRVKYMPYLLQYLPNVAVPIGTDLAAQAASVPRHSNSPDSSLPHPSPPLVHDHGAPHTMEIRPEIHVPGHLEPREDSPVRLPRDPEHPDPDQTPLTESNNNTPDESMIPSCRSDPSPQAESSGISSLMPYDSEIPPEELSKIPSPFRNAPGTPGKRRVLYIDV